MSASEDNNRICRGWGCQREFKWRRKKGLPPDECTSFEVEAEAEARQERNSRKSRMQCNAHCQTLTGMPKAAGRGRGRVQEAGADIARVKPKGLGRGLSLSLCLRHSNDKCWWSCFGIFVVAEYLEYSGKQRGQLFRLRIVHDKVVRAARCQLWSRRHCHHRWRVINSVCSLTPRGTFPKRYLHCRFGVLRVPRTVLPYPLSPLHCTRVHAFQSN